MEAPRYYPPIEQSELVRVIRLLFATRTEFLEHIAPNGFAESVYVLVYRPHIFKHYLRYRADRIHHPGFRNGPRMTLMEFTKQKLATTGELAKVDPALEATMLMGNAVIDIFNYPHAVFNNRQQCYRFTPRFDQPYEFHKFLHDVLYTDGILPKPFSGDFNFNRLHKYGDSLYCGTSVDFHTAYYFIFLQLKSLGLDWDFGSDTYWLNDRMFFNARDGESDLDTHIDWPEDHSTYNPQTQALQSLSGRHEDEEDRYNEEPDEREETLLNISELMDDSVEMWSYVEMRKDFIKAYVAVHGRHPRSYPPLSFGKDGN